MFTYIEALDFDLLSVANAVGNGRNIVSKTERDMPRIPRDTPIS